MVFDRDKVFGLAKMVINLQVTLVEIAKMDTDSISGQTETFIKASFAKIWDKARAKWYGTMEVRMEDNGKEVFLMEKVNFSLIKSGIFKVKGEKAHVGIF